MNIINQQLNTPYKKTSLKNQNASTVAPAFKGSVYKMWNKTNKFLADEPVWGATIIDLAAMVAPRTWTDGKNRGFNAGFETGFREAESSGNDAAVGLYGVAAGAAIAGAVNKKYGVHVNRIFASTDASQVYTAKWNKNAGNMDNYIKDIVDNIEAFNPNSSKADAKGYVRIPDDHKQGIIEDLKTIANAAPDKMQKAWKATKDNLSARMLDALGVEDSLKLVHKEGTTEKATVATSKTLMENFYHMTKAFKSDKVASKTNEFLKDYHKFGNMRTAIGILIAGIFAVGAQPLNVYLSKKRTGTDGFVGVEGRKKDNSLGFKALKTASSLGMIGIMLATLGALPKNPKKFKDIPKLFLEKNQYKGKNPTINQFKTVFGLAITSRLLTARDKDEHREVVTKDVLGFFNWLMLGNVFNQLIIHKFQDKGANLLKREPLPKNAGWWKRTVNFLNSSIATHSEVAIEGLKKETGVKSIIKPNGKAMTFDEIFKALPKNGQTRKNLRLLNIAQLGGYIYSAVVLGFGIPHLNIYMTNMSDKRKKAKLAQAQQGQQAQAVTNNNQNTAIDKQVKESAFSTIKTHKASA